MNLGKHLVFGWLFVSCVKTGTRRIKRLDEPPSIARLERSTAEDSLSRWLMRLVPVFILENNNLTNKKCFPKFIQTDNRSPVRKRPICWLNKAIKSGIASYTILQQFGGKDIEELIHFCFNQT